MVFVLIPLWGLLIVIDRAALTCKWGYKKFHIAGEKLAAHIDSKIKAEWPD